MDRILLIQMARMGDFLQTTPLIYGLKKSNPNCTLSVLADSALYDVIDNCEYVDDILTVDMKNMSMLFQEQRKMSLLYKAFHDECLFIKDQTFDMIVNVNLSPISATLSALTQSERSRGYRLNPESGKIMKDPWFAFFNVMVKHLPLAPFNLVDYFYYLENTAHNHPKHLFFNHRITDRSEVLKRLSITNIKNDDLMIVIQLTTRHEHRQWPLQKFVELAKNIMQHKNVHIVLTGTIEDRDVADGFKSSLQHMCGTSQCRIHNAAGKTNIDQLASLLHFSDLLITCDTGTMHVATAVDCRVLALFIGPAFAYNTGPYGEEHWVIQTNYPCGPCIEDTDECTEHICKNAIEPALVFSIIENILFNEKNNFHVPDNIEILKSGFDEWGIMYEPVVTRPVTMNIVRNLCYREIGKQLIDTTYKTAPLTIERCKSIYGPSNDSNFHSGVRETLHQAQNVIHACYDSPCDVMRLRLDERFSFWHPWIDFYIEARNNGNDFSSVQVFEKGVRTARTILKSFNTHFYLN